jgi:hypothetical protein
MYQMTTRIQVRSGSDPCLSKIHCDFAELFEGGYEVFDDLLNENIRDRRDCWSFQPFVSAPGDVEAVLILVELRSNIQNVPFVSPIS